MKTPREILFARHRNAAPKLDAIRRDVLNVVFQNENPIPFYLNLPLMFWRELIFPCRRIWSALAAVWILIFAVNFSQRDPSELMARKSPPPSQEMILTFRQQEILLAELIGQSETQTAEPPKTFSPRPSSERRFETLTV
jgi:hypothetical protein